MSTIGILINHYDARNDIRDLVAELSLRHKVVLLGPAGSVFSEHLAPGVEFRPCRRVRPAWRWIVDQAYRHFGFIPRSKDNFYINELFKLERLTGFRRLAAKVSLFIRMHAPVRISPESYLRMLRGCDATEIADLDGFLLITEFSDNALTARIIDSGKPNCAYVYSWDHPCKHTVMARGIRRYAVWNSRLADDMRDLQGIPKQACVVVGATQLVPIHEALAQADPPGTARIEGKPYFYYGCGVGPLDLARQEMEVVRRLAAAMQEHAPGHILLVRPYPMSHGVNLRPMLAAFPNVRWDDEFRAKQVGRSLGAGDISQRIHLQRGAQAFFHIGTTMGFEGAFLDVPCVLLRPPRGNEPDAGKFRKLGEFSSQYHLEQHLSSPVNTVGLGAQLGEAVRACLTGAAQIKDDNARVRADARLQPMREIAATLADLSLS